MNVALCTRDLLAGTAGPKYTSVAQELIHNKSILPIWQKRFGPELQGIITENAHRWPLSTPGLVWRNPIAWKGKFFAIPANNKNFGAGYLVVSVFHVAFVKEFTVTSCLCCNTTVCEFVSGSICLLGLATVTSEIIEGECCVVVTTMLNGEPVRHAYQCPGMIRPGVPPARPFAMLCQEQGRFLRSFWPPNTSIVGQANQALLSSYHLVQLLANSDPVSGEEALTKLRASADSWMTAYDRHAGLAALDDATILPELVAIYAIARSCGGIRISAPLTDQVKLMPVSAAANPQLSRLIVSGSALADFEALRKFMSMSKSLASVFLDGVNVVAGQLQSLFTPSILPRGLAELYLRKCSITDEALDVVALFVTTSPLLVRALVLDENCFSDNALERLASAMIFRRYPLHRFSVLGCRRIIRPKVLAALAPVSEICLTGNMIELNSEAAAVLSTFRGRLVCNMRELPFGPGLDLFGAFLASTPFGAHDLPSLVHLDEGITMWQRLQSCDGYSRRMIDVTIVFPGDDRSNPLIRQSFDQPVRCVSGLVVLSTSSLRAMELIRCASNCRRAVWSHNNRSCPYPAALKQALRSTIANHTALVHLDLSDNMLLDQGAEALAGGLRVNRTLVTINFDRNGTSEVGWKALRGIFYGNKKVVVLDLSKDIEVRLGQLEQTIQQHQQAEWHFQAEMKSWYRRRNPQMGQACCRKMVMAKGQLRVAKKVKTIAEATLSNIKQALAFNKEAAKPKLQREQERTQARAHKAAEQWAREQAKWKSNLEKQADTEAKKESASNRVPPPAATSRPLVGQKTGHLVAEMGAVVTVPRGAPWYKSRPPRHERLRPALNVMQRRINLLIAELLNSGDISRHVLVLDDMLPGLEAAYRSRHAAYVHSLRQVTAIPLAPGWARGVDAFGTPCYVHTLTETATYAEPRLEREVASFFSKNGIDIGQPLYAVLLPRQLASLDPEQLYCYNLYLAFYFQNFAFPLPSERRNFLFNIPAIENMQQQPPVVNIALAANALLAASAAGGVDFKTVLDPAAFFALHGLTPNMYDSIDASDFAYCEDEWMVRRFWSPPPVPQVHVLSNMSTQVLNGTFEREPRFRALVALQDMYRQIQFGWLEDEDEISRDDAKLLARANKRLKSSCSKDNDCYGAVGFCMPLDDYSIDDDYNPASGWNANGRQNLNSAKRLLSASHIIRLPSAEPAAHMGSPTEQASSYESSRRTAGGGGSSSASSDTPKEKSWKELEMEIIVKTFRDAPASVFPEVAARRCKHIVAGSLPVGNHENRTHADFAVVTQCSVDRIARLQRLGQSLRSFLPTASTALPVHFAAAVYVSELACASSAHADWRKLLQQLRALSKKLVAHKNVISCTLLVVRERDIRLGLAQGFYPINMLRNIVTDYARDDLQAQVGLLVDVDFAVGPSLFDSAWSYFCTDEGNELLHGLMGHDTQCRRTAIVLPALESTTAIASTTTAATDTKAALLELCDTFDKGGCVAFHVSHYWKGHGPSNTDEWMRLAKEAAVQGESAAACCRAYDATFVEGFEPYVIVSLKDIPKYDARFVGYGLNKVQHAVHMNAIGFKFVVAPLLYVHCYPHERNESWERTFAKAQNGFDPVQRYWLQGLYDRFCAEICASN